MSEYKRLTIKDNKKLSLCCDNCNAPKDSYTDECDGDCYAEMYLRLEELENKIESGRLVELPCKVGDTVYYINDYGMGQYKIIPFNVSGFKIGINNRLYVLFDFDSFAFAEDIFITKEAAEARLKELQEKQL